MSKDNARPNKACSASTFHNYNTRYRKSHPYNTRHHCSSSRSGSHNDVSRFVSTSTKKAERPACPISSAPVLVQPNTNKYTNASSSVVTPKQSNCLLNKMPVIKSIQNPYNKPNRNTHADTSNLQNSSASAPNDCNTVSPLPECVVSIGHKSQTIISPPTQTSQLKIAQKRRIAMNKARALAIRAKAVYTTPLKEKEAPVSPRNQEHEKINMSISDHVGGNLVSSTSAMATNKWNCAICGSIVNPYILDRSIIENGDPICANCLANIKFSQESVASVND